MNKLNSPFYIIFHPIEGFEILAYKKAGKISIASAISILTFLSMILLRQVSGFIFNSHINPLDLNVPSIFAQTILFYFGFSVVNWSLCTLFDGKGKLKDIWIVLNYSLIPYLISNLLILIFTNFLIKEEEVFVKIISNIGYGYTLFLLIKGIEAIHHFSFSQSIISIVATIIGIAIILIILILLIAISQQIFGFAITVTKEIMFRLKQ